MSPSGIIRRVQRGLVVVIVAWVGFCSGALCAAAGDGGPVALAPLGAGDAIEFNLDINHPVVDPAVDVALAPFTHHGLGRVTPLFSRPIDQLELSRSEAVMESGEPAEPLAGWHRISLAAVDLAARPEVAQRVCHALLGCAGIRSAEFVPALVPAVIQGYPTDDPSCPIRTPLYDALQGYLAPAPVGIDVGAAWERPGGRGQGLWFADIEGNWNNRHEDLPGERIFHVAGNRIDDRGWESHGTAVLGVVASRDNRLGMIGIAPNVDRILTGAVGNLPTADAIDQTAALMRPGDVLLIELHGPGPRSYPGGGQKGYVPVEWWQAAFDVIRTHTARGIVIVEAAGNGGENLDDPIYVKRFDRTVRNSNAILVGAGGPNTGGFVDRSRLDFSNYGSRVDLQGYGRMVATLDYGDLQGCGEVSRKYTNQFAGTSSASPIVAGAALVLQAVYKARTGSVLPAQTLRDLMVKTGSPQTDGPHGPATQNIGPRPDLRRALEALPIDPAVRKR